MSHYVFKELQIPQLPCLLRWDGKQSIIFSIQQQQCLSNALDKPPELSLILVVQTGDVVIIIAM